MKLLLDQDVYAATARFLKTRGHDVVTVAQISHQRSSAGTARSLMAYLRMVFSHYRCLLSLMTPEMMLRPDPISSPKPATMPTTVALAPGIAS
ncbi:hypothetical protein L0128_15455 [candidate division KSB1 bacterium]|nr:hypothetical protein [candidate division KSB1 bacterium]